MIDRIGGVTSNGTLVVNETFLYLHNFFFTSLVDRVSAGGGCDVAVAVMLY